MSRCDIFLVQVILVQLHQTLLPVLVLGPKSLVRFGPTRYAWANYAFGITYYAFEPIMLKIMLLIPED